MINKVFWLTFGGTLHFDKISLCLKFLTWCYSWSPEFLKFHTLLLEFTKSAHGELTFWRQSSQKTRKIRFFKPCKKWSFVISFEEHNIWILQIMRIKSNKLFKKNRTLKKLWKLHLILIRRSWSSEIHDAFLLNLGLQWQSELSESSS